MADRNFDNINETAEDRSVGELLRTLKRVDPPNDFDFKLKARIADQVSKADGRQGWWPLPVYVYTLLVLAAMAAAFFFVYRPGSEPTPSIASRDSETPAVAPPSPPTTAPPDKEQEIAVSPNQKNRGTSPADPKTPRKMNAETGGSRDTALGDPVVFNTRLLAAFNFLGLDTKFEGKTLKVASVRSGSVGDKTGLKAGDLIEAINNAPIADLGTSFQIKTVTVRRGAEQLHLDIQTR